jgi:hypothetical protein
VFQHILATGTDSPAPAYLLLAILRMTLLVVH